MKQMGFTIRRSVPADEAQIEALFRQMMAAIRPDGPIRGYDPGYLKKNFFEREGNPIYVAEIGGAVAAFLSVEHHGEGESEHLYLDDFSVAPEHRGKGMGTALLRRAEEYAGELGVKMLVLHVERTNPRAIALYEREGYRASGTRDSRIRMVKMLP